MRCACGASKLLYRPEPRLQTVKCIPILADEQQESTVNILSPSHLVLICHQADH